MKGTLFAEASLRAAHLQFPVAETLNSEPQIIRPSIDNGRAIGHALRLSSFYYPNAYGSGYKALPFTAVSRLAARQDVVTFGIGHDHVLDAGLLLSTPFGYGSYEDLTPTIAYLFKVPSEHTRRSGQQLLAAGFEYLMTTEASRVSLAVNKRNTVARQLYENLGFIAGPRSDGSNGRTLLQMTLFGAPAIEQANQKLKAQL